MSPDPLHVLRRLCHSHVDGLADRTRASPPAERRTPTGILAPIVARTNPCWLRGTWALTKSQRLVTKLDLPAPTTVLRYNRDVQVLVDHAGAGFLWLS